MTHGSLFSGIGGFDLAAEWAGWNNIFQVEIDSFCQKVLAKNFPTVKRYTDIKQFDAHEYKRHIDVISGGFPCQPFSVAGKRQGKNDNRFLWDEMYRVITEVQPHWVVAENVSGILSIEQGLVFERVCLDLESAGYSVQAFVIPACATGAPHRRDRVWFVAHNDSTWELQQKGSIKNSKQWVSNGTAKDPDSSAYGIVQAEGYNGQHWHISATDEVRATADTNGEYSKESLGRNQFRQTRRALPSGRGIYEPTWEDHWTKVAARLCRMDDGLPRRMDRINRLKALGNAIVPQVAFQIFNSINLYHDNYRN